MSRFQRAAPTVVRSISILMAGPLIGALEKFQSGERLQLAVRSQRQPSRRQQEQQSISQKSHWGDRYRTIPVCSNKKGVTESITLSWLSRSR